MNLQTLIFLSLLSLLASCASRSLDVDYDLPFAEYGMQPETLGGLKKFELSGNLHVKHDVELGGTDQSESIFSSSPSSVSINTTNPTVNDGLNVGFSGSLGVLKFFDLQVRKSPQGLYLYGGKLCLLLNCTSKDKGWKFSLYGFYGDQDDDENSKNSFFSDNDDPDEFSNVSANLKLKGQVFGLTFGQRVSPTKLYYFNGNYSKVEARSFVNIENGSNFNLNADTESYSFLLGFREETSKDESRSFFFYVEAGYGALKFRGTRKRKDDGLMGAIGIGLSIL